MGCVRNDDWSISVGIHFADEDSCGIVRRGRGLRSTLRSLVVITEPSRPSNYLVCYTIFVKIALEVFIRSISLPISFERYNDLGAVDNGKCTKVSLCCAVFARVGGHKLPVLFWVIPYVVVSISKPVEIVFVELPLQVCQLENLIDILQVGSCRHAVPFIVRGIELNAKAEFSV